MNYEPISTRRLVLVVDDSPETLGHLIEALEAASLTALIARDGVSAIELLDRIKPDLILLDAVMPGMDGFETCRRIKEQAAFSLTPVIFLTGLSDSENIVQGLRAGGVDYVVKPIEHDVLLERIRIHIANADLITEARAAIDATGPGVFAVSPDFNVLWASSAAIEVMGAGMELLPGKIVADFRDWARRVATQPVSEAERFMAALSPTKAVFVEMLGRSVKSDLLFRIVIDENIPEGELLARELGVSTREGEVLAWIANGKSNKDIATILGLSPRTVTKHLEQIFQKLGVENRTSAAITALKVLQR